MKVETVILDKRIEAPKYATPKAAAVDLRACRIDEKPITENINLYPGAKVKIGAGFAIHLEGMLEEEDGDMMRGAALILPRSGLGSAGIVLSNTVGLLDSDYCKEILMAIENRGNDVFVIEPLMRLAQMAIIPVIAPQFEIVEQFSNGTDRGGFGSTGVL